MKTNTSVSVTHTMPPNKEIMMLLQVTKDKIGNLPNLLNWHKKNKTIGSVNGYTK